MVETNKELFCANGCSILNMCQSAPPKLGKDLSAQERFVIFLCLCQQSSVRQMKNENVPMVCVSGQICKSEEYNCLK